MIESQLIEGDWLTEAPGLAPCSADLLYADPPFNTGKAQTAQAGSYADAWPTTEAWVTWLEQRLTATLPALKPTASILLHVDWRTSHHARLLLDRLLGPDHFVNHLVWSYGLGGSSPRRFARKHDDILFYAIDPARYYFEPPMVPATSNRMKGQLKKATDVIDIPTDVIKVPSLNNMAGERAGYPTQKPLALLEMLVGACCPPGGAVLDPCCGSGTTLVAAATSGRHATGIDRNPEAIAVAQARLAGPAP
ncbi:MAG: DNA modification methylase [Phycisphaerales bacterium]